MTSFTSKIDGAYPLMPRFFDDARGFFLKRNFAKLAIGADFLKNNHNLLAINVLRGSAGAFAIYLINKALTHNLLQFLHS
jgi:dTDP-4-dehydrorhamnose 3,5-epimerase-like enzyme